MKEIILYVFLSIHKHVRYAEVLDNQSQLAKLKLKVKGSKTSHVHCFAEKQLGYWIKLLATAERKTIFYFFKSEHMLIVKRNIKCSRSDLEISCERSHKFHSSSTFWFQEEFITHG